MKGLLTNVKATFTKFLPTTRPNIDMLWAIKKAHEAGVDFNKEVCIIGVRGFYNKGANTRGRYDDAACIIGPGSLFKTFNFNTDPHTSRAGIASLVPGVWKYTLGIHGLSKPKFLQYRALVQAAPVSVARDGWRDLDNGWFGINIHRDGLFSLYSIGCQTVYKKQWDDFIGTVETSMKKANQKTIKYILVEDK